MKKYWNNPAATAEAFQGGWFHSGDLVRQDDEGYCYVVDRNKDMIISGGGEHLLRRGGRRRRTRPQVGRDPIGRHRPARPVRASYPGRDRGVQQGPPG
nr:AMP-binding protein [Nonomuraea ceibae]